MSSRLCPDDPEYQPIAQMVADRFANSPSLAISGRDEIYSDTESVCGSRTLGLMSYFRSGMQIEDTVRQLIDWHFEGRPPSVSLLEFDAGYGRSTRFLAADFGAAQVWASGLLPDALEFDASEFHVQTVLATQKSEAFKPGRQWDCIFVSSFLNGLSEVEFTRWLWKFHSLLAPSGLLIFTACSGNSAVPLGFVHQAIIAVTGSLSHTHIPQGLCFTHDLFAVAKGQLRTEPIQFQYGPNGWVDSCRWTEPYQMKLAGWAFDPTPGESISRIDLYYNGRPKACGIINHDRPDVPTPIRCGWDCIADLSGENIRSALDWILVKAISTSGRAFVLRLDHPSEIGGFESMSGWEYDETQGRSRAILPVKRFIDFPVNGHFTTADTTFSGWVASADAESLEQILLVGTFGNIPYTLVQRPDVYADHHLHSLGFEAILPPEYLTVSDQKLRLVTRSGVVLTTFETVVDYVAGS